MSSLTNHPARKSALKKRPQEKTSENNKNNDKSDPKH